MREARASSTQETQILYGHCAEILGTEGKWFRVRGADGYEGWLHEGYAEMGEGPDCGEWAWDLDREMSMGCSMRDSRSVTIDLPLDKIAPSGKCINGRSIGLAKRRE